MQNENSSPSGDNHSSTEGEDSDGKHTPPYIVGSSAESDSGIRLAAVDSTPLMQESKPNKVAFRKSNMLDSQKIIHDVIIPSYFQFVKQFNYIYSSTTSRYYGISSIYTRLIENVINQPPSYNYSHVLHDENDLTNIVGHILLAPPHAIRGSLSPNRYEIMRDLYWLQPIYHGIGTMWRSYKLEQAINLLLHTNLESHCSRYWCAECVAIKPIWQRNGFGSILLESSHKFIEKKVKSDNLDQKLPIVTLTTTERSVKFYLRNGYETFQTIIVDKSSNLMLYGLLYHYDQEIKKKWINTLRDNLPYKIEFNWYQHILPQTWCQSLQFLIKISLLGIYLLICLILRFFIGGYRR